MLPNGGGTFIVHVLIIIINWIIKKPIHFLIILLVLTFFSSQIILLAKTSVKDNNFSYLQDIYKCFNHDKIDINKKYIILRLDDIQASYLSDLSTKMINDGLKRNIPFTLGVIPMNLHTDVNIVNYLRKNKCNLEIALHGFNNRQDYPEFKDLSESEAKLKLTAGLQELNKLTDENIYTFIPPDNVYSTGTIGALKNSDFKIISAEGHSYFDYSSTTYFFDKKKLNDVNSILQKSIEDTKNKGFSIIMIHPQDYIDELGKIDDKKYSEYIKLLDNLQNQGFSFTTMKDYYKYLNKEGIKPDFFDRTTDLNEFNKLNKKVLENRKG